MSGHMKTMAALLWLLLAPSFAHAVETGTAIIIHADRADGTAEFRTSVDLDRGGRVLVATGQKPLRTDVQHGDRVLVTPIRAAVAQGKVVTRWQIEPLRVSRLGATAASVSGTHRVLIMLVSYRDKPHPLTSPTQASGTSAAVAPFFSADSYGALSMPTDVVGPYTIAAAASSGDFWTISDQADAAAMAAGVPLGLYQHRVYALPSASAFGWSGLGTVGGNPSRAWLNGTMQPLVLIHELGHNLGLYHSHALSCSGVGICASGTRREYGDVYDVMGSGRAGFNAAQKERLGWLTARRVGDGAHTLAPLETAPDALRLSRPDGSSLVVEARRTDGVLVHLDAGPDAISLLDSTPLTPSWADSALAPGLALLDPAGLLRLGVTASGASGATVTIGAPGVVVPPIVPPPPPPPDGGILTLTAHSPIGREMTFSGGLTGALALTATIDGVAIAARFIVVDRARKTWSAKASGLFPGPHVFVATSGLMAVTKAFVVVR